MEGAARRIATAVGAGWLLALGSLTAPAVRADGGEPAPQAVAHLHGPVPAEDVAQLMAEAVRLSGLPALPASAVPSVWSVSEATLRSVVCASEQGAHCNGLQAAYDTDANRILVLEWGRQRGAEWESFVVHELVHALQYAHRGEPMFDGCAALRATEQQAYDVQDAYLRKRGALLRTGSQMWWWQCPEDGTRPAARTGTDASAP